MVDAVHAAAYVGGSALQMNPHPWAEGTLTLGPVSAWPLGVACAKEGRLCRIAGERGDGTGPSRRNMMTL